MSFIQEAFACYLAERGPLCCHGFSFQLSRILQPRTRLGTRICPWRGQRSGSQIRTGIHNTL